MKSIRQRFHRFTPTRSMIGKVGLSMLGLGLFTLIGWVGHSRFVALQRQTPGGAIVQSGSNRLSDSHSQLRAQAAKLACLQQDLEEQRRILRSLIIESKSVTTVQTKQLSSIENKIRQNSWRLQDLESDRTMVERVAEASRPGVCMIVGEYLWTDQASGRPLRYEGLDAWGEPLRWPDGQVRIGVGGDGPVVAREFSGTGFLIDSAGAVLTSSFLLAPWERDPLIQPAITMRAYPSMQLLRAYFPDLDGPVELTIWRASENREAVICRFDPGEVRLPSLPLQQGTHQPSTGEPVVLLGYPGGVELMVAQLPEEQMRAILGSGKTTKDELAQALARRRFIQPLVIQGRISGQLDGRLFYDGTTTFGGSGGPLLNKRGEVIGIEVAISPEFSGSNLAISTGSFRRWLAESGFGAAPDKSVASGNQHIELRTRRGRND